jgi:hypothetical protein
LREKNAGNDYSQWGELGYLDGGKGPCRELAKRIQSIYFRLSFEGITTCPLVVTTSIFMARNLSGKKYNLFIFVSQLNNRITILVRNAIKQPSPTLGLIKSKGPIP